MENKYKFTEDTIETKGHTLHRIEALKDFSDVKKGDLGGWIEKEENLSQEGNCWVYNEAWALEDAIIKDDAKVYNNSLIYGHAIVKRNAKISGAAQIFDYAIVDINSLVANYAKVYNNALICGLAIVGDDAQIYGRASVYGYSTISGRAKIYGYASIYGDSLIDEDAQIYGNISVYGTASIKGDAKLSKIGDYYNLINIWNNEADITWTKSNNMWDAGFFYGTGEELIKKAYEKSEKDGINYEKCVKFIEDLNKE